jgi:hypothetical protein
MRRRPRQGELIRHRWEEHIVKTHLDHDSTLAAVPIGARPFSRQRPRHRAGIAAAVGVVSVALTGCSGSSPQPAESAQRSPTAAGEPQPGTCWVVPATSVADSDVRFDDSPQVPCTDRHTTETVTTYSLAEPSIDEAERLLLDCFDDVRVYLGIDEDSWVPWGVAAYLPSKEEVADGAGWMRCDAFFPTTTYNSGARTTDVSAKGIADAPPADFLGCTDEYPAK